MKITMTGNGTTFGGATEVGVVDAMIAAMCPAPMERRAFVRLYVAMAATMGRHLRGFAIGPDATMTDEEACEELVHSLIRCGIATLVES